MSDKISGFTVVFDKSVSEEYMDKVKQSLFLLKGVASVEPCVEDTSVYIGQAQERHRVIKVLIDLIQTDFGNKKPTE